MMVIELPLAFLRIVFTLIGKSDPLAFYLVVTVVGVLGELPGARSPTPLFPCDGASGGLWLCCVLLGFPSCLVVWQRL